MSTSTAGSATPKNSGAAYQWSIRIFGAIVIGAVFLPFMGKMSILDYMQSFLLKADMIGWGPTLELTFGGPTLMIAVTNSVLVLSFVFFPLLGLSMLLRGKYQGGPLTFVILYNVAAWCLVHFGGLGATDVSFFSMVGYGYWIACGALIAPMISMFFLDKSI